MGGLLYHRQSALPHSAPALLAVVALTHLVLPPGSSLFATPPHQVDGNVHPSSVGLVITSLIRASPGVSAEVSPWSLSGSGDFALIHSWICARS